MKKKSTDDIDSSEVINSKTSEIKPSPDTHTGELVVSLEKVTFNGEECTGDDPVLDINKDDVTSLTIKGYYFPHEKQFNDFINLRSVTIEDEIDPWYDAFYGCRSFTEFIVPETNPDFCAIDGLLIYKKKMSLEMIPSGKGPHVSIPEGIKILRYLSLDSCPDLVSIELPSTITYIDCLSHKENKKLKSFSVAENNPSYMAEDGVLFTKNKGMLFAFPNDKGPEYTIPSGVAVIGEDAFSGCSKLRSITIPSSMVRIAYDGFAGCVKLKEIHVQAKVCPTFHSEDEPFCHVYKATLYVPRGTKKLYEENEKWNVFSKIEEE